MEGGLRAKEGIRKELHLSGRTKRQVGKTITRGIALSECPQREMEDVKTPGDGLKADNKIEALQRGPELLHGHRPGKNGRRP